MTRETAMVAIVARIDEGIGIITGSHQEGGRDLYSLSAGFAQA
jgi:hypothetical protein